MADGVTPLELSLAGWFAAPEARYHNVDPAEVQFLVWKRTQDRADLYQTHYGFEEFDRDDRLDPPEFWMHASLANTLKSFPATSLTPGVALIGRILGIDGPHALIDAIADLKSRTRIHRSMARKGLIHPIEMEMNAFGASLERLIADWYRERHQDRDKGAHPPFDEMRSLFTYFNYRMGWGYRRAEWTKDRGVESQVLGF